MTTKITKDVAKTLSELVSIRNAESFPRYQKPFVDYLRLKCVGGAGGSPVENQKRSKKLNGPGYGGHGGSVYFKATHLVSDFIHIESVIKGKSGGNAHGTSRGLHASDTVINIPLGSILRKRVRRDDRTRCIFWHQFLNPDEKLLIARGGRGGLGPSCFKKHDNRLAEVGESITLELELRLFNDVAFIGLPNSGKTSLISSLTSYMTRIGPEEGSTTRPHIALIKFLDGVDIRVMDLPPLSQNTDKDMVKKITRHLYRSKLIAYVISAAEDGDHMETLKSLREIVSGSKTFVDSKLEMIIMTKCDMIHRNTLFNLDSLYYKLLDSQPEIPVVATSATHRLGLDRCVRTIRDLLYPRNVTYTKRELVESYEIKLLTP
ncbi:GTP-binding protein, putative [Theileria annulata]|uniref:GTP-binding protein, putative n=1 Tax=Theileria annulata TaxID=5874 RepID=Q4UEF7_THEAN|nr:GTP-binding protein, putative [Theileria annulata]CAI74532.1 GTP-binding protein, putative [Theileria annulata]|eukprot:XP_952264.1 GTP-binding protein, putative [Theileria annulata]